MSSTLRSFFRALTRFRSSTRITEHPTRPYSASRWTQLIEEPDLYKPGGYHRVQLGDTFQDQSYEVLRKLGYGQYSTVWLARDLRHEGYVALKILKADCYGGDNDIFEVEMLQHINQIMKTSDHPGRGHVLGLRDHFDHEGPNGKHTCLVFNLLGQNMQTQVHNFTSCRVPVRTVKIITRQLLQALDFLHQECQIIHTDFKPSNILLELPSPSEHITQYLSTTQPSVVTIPDVARENLPYDDIKPSFELPLAETLPSPVISEMENARVQLIDLGVSSWVDRHLTDLIQSPLLRAPEVTLGAPWSTGVDIWSLGCLLLEWVKGYRSFQGFANEEQGWTEVDDRLSMLEATLGPFPKQLLEKGTKSKDFFDEQGKLLRIPSMRPASLMEILDGDHPVLKRPDDMPENEVPSFADFLSGTFALDPEQRKCASNLLRHPWLEIT